MKNLNKGRWTRHGRALGAVLVCVSVALCIPWNARAQQIDVGKANEQGREHYRNGKYEEAIAIWEEAFFRASGEDELKLAKNLGVAYRRLDDLDKIFYYFSYRYALLPPQKREAKLKDALLLLTEALSPGKTLVEVTVDRPGATVYIDRIAPENRFKAPMWWFFEPGEYTVFVIEGRLKEEKVLKVKAGGDQKLHVQLQEKPLTIPDPPQEPTRPSKGQRIGSWITLGGGVALGAVGGILCGVAYSRSVDIQDEAETKFEEDESQAAEIEQDRGRRMDDEVHPLRNSGIALIVVGAGAAVGGIVWAAVNYGKEKKSKVSFSPAITPDGTTGFSFAMTF